MKIRGRLGGRVGAWAAGAVAGVVVGSAVGLSVQAWQDGREDSDLAARGEAFAHRDDVPPPADAIQDLLDQDSLVAVDPLLAGRIPESDLQRAEELLAASPVPARIAYLSYPADIESGYTVSGAGPQWWTNVGEKGHYVVLWDNGNYDSGAVGLEPEYVDARTQGQPGPALVRVAEEMATWEAVPLPTEPEGPSDFDYWGGVGGGIGAAALFGAIGVVPVFFLLRWFVGSRRRKAAA